MKTRTPLDEFIDRLVQKSPASGSTLSIPRHVYAPEVKLPSDKDLERDMKRDSGVTLPRGTAPELASAYHRYWTLPETEPLEAFQVAYREISRLEGQIAPGIAWRTLREAATAYHAETGACPFCRNAGDLHLLLDQLSMELRDGR